MNLYDKYILPKAIDWACSHRPFNKQREMIVPLAKGNVLEIGIGSGLNLPYYGKEVDYVLGIDPAEEVWHQNKIDTQKLPFAFDFQKAFAENIPAENNSFDAVVITYAMCSIPKTNEAFEEAANLAEKDWDQDWVDELLSDDTDQILFRGRH